MLCLHICHECHLLLLYTHPHIPPFPSLHTHTHTHTHPPFTHTHTHTHTLPSSSPLSPHPSPLTPHPSQSHKSSPKKSVKHASSLSSSNETVTMNGSSPGAVTPSPSSSSPSTSSHVHHGGGGGGGGGLATSSSVSSLGLSQSLDRPTARKNKGRQNQLLKNRSRSVFIRLQLPQRTPPPAHRPLSVVEEGTQRLEMYMY